MFVDIVCTVWNGLFYVPVVLNVVVFERMKVIGERNSIGGE